MIEIMSGIFYAALTVIAILGALLIFLMERFYRLKKDGAKPNELRPFKCLAWVVAAGLVMGVASVGLSAADMTSAQNQCSYFAVLVLFGISAAALAATVFALVTLVLK